MSKWAELTSLVRESWDVMLERVSFEEIGVFIYDKITQQEQLEPLFSFADKAMQGRKFVDMLNRLAPAISIVAKTRLGLSRAPDELRRATKRTIAPPQSYGEH
jgi:hypothetical protein